MGCCMVIITNCFWRYQSVRGITCVNPLKGFSADRLGHNLLLTMILRD